MIWQPVNITQSCASQTNVTGCFGYIYLSLLVQLYGDSIDRKMQAQFGIQQGPPNSSDPDTFDFIVVGAGAAGSVVTNRLTQQENWKVLLLEAGGEQPDVSRVPSLAAVMFGSEVDWNYRTQGDPRACREYPGGGCIWPRGRMMGGTTSLNAMVYIRGSRADYDGWAALGNPGWSYADVLPVFKRLENNLDVEGKNRLYHGVKGLQKISRFPYFDDTFVAIIEGFRELGLPLADLNGEEQLGAMFGQSFQVNGQRYSVNDAFIQPIRYRRKNLTVRIRSEVTKILIDENHRAYGVSYTRDGKTYEAFAKKEVIICTGTINSPKLLLLSGIGPKDELEAIGINVVQDLSVGRNLQDHYGFSGLVVDLPAPYNSYLPREKILDSIKDYYLQGDVKNGPIASNSILSGLNFFKVYPDSEFADAQVQFCNIYDLNAFLDDPTLSCGFERLPSAYYSAMMPIVSNIVPHSKGKITLNGSNPNGPPLIYANYYEDPRDMESTIRIAKSLINLENTKAFKSKGYKFVRKSLPACRKYIWGTDDYIECLARSYTETYNHQAGTCKMGPKSDKNAVVDPKLRVYGIIGLRVIDASIMPVVNRGNTQAPSMMIGERGIDFVIKEWLRRERIANKREGISKKNE